MSEGIIDSLKVAVDNRSLAPEIVNLLIPDDRPFDCEGQLWDYKIKAPVPFENATDAQRSEYRVAIGEFVKDAVAFHNAYGGYILIGVANKGRNRLTGFEGEFNCAELNAAIKTYAGTSIECLYHTFLKPVQGRSEPVRLGLLLIPRRAAGAPPVKFLRDGPKKTDGKPIFTAQVYVRVLDACRPAANAHEDWLLLHSDRLPPEQAPGRSAIAIQSHLPARDSDLIEFVGREEQLTSLRQWISDPRSPVRLITGIGGLGKTTLAFRFAEEVLETGAGEVEAIIWLTAKQQTYSALRGKMVPIAKVDFADLSSLFSSILRTLSYEMPVSDEEPSFAEISDRLAEALTFIPSLLIVDDLDSLSPDEQRETVSALNSIATRTVGRELSPSRVLMTSRIDQGLPPTAIVKITGLDRPNFETHLGNLCATFSIPAYSTHEMDEIFEASSGSPLFAASIVRLVKIGEDRREVVEKWKGADGEDVRSFAFERELERIGSMEARILYAVMLLGETTLNDIAEVLELPPRVVRQNLAELQAYHLLASTSKAQGDSAISVPSELQAVAELLKGQLGTVSKSVEEAVARAHEKSGNLERQVGAAVRSVARLWAQDKFDEALLLAFDLKTKFSDNGDIASLLGAALLRVRPPRYRDADRALEAANKLGCAKSELLPNMIRTKEHLEDWIGLRELTKSKISKDTDRDITLAAHLRANRELIAIARIRHDWVRLSELAIEAVERITAKIRRTRLDSAYFSSLTSARADFSRAYIDALDRQFQRPGDRLRVFEGVTRLAASDVVLVGLLERGIVALEGWWSDVENRPVADTSACKILSRMLAKLEGIEQQLAGYKRDTGPSMDFELRRRELEYRGGALQASIG